MMIIANIIIIIVISTLVPTTFHQCKQSTAISSSASFVLAIFPVLLPARSKSSRYLCMVVRCS